MVFFKEAVEHITRAARVFRQPGAHMILVRKLIFYIYIAVHLKKKNPKGTHGIGVLCRMCTCPDQEGSFNLHYLLLSLHVLPD